MEKLAYFYGPIGILLFINFVLFASTTRQLTCGLWKREDVKSTTERYFYKCFLYPYQWYFGNISFFWYSTTLGAITLKLVIVMVNLIFNLFLKDQIYTGIKDLNIQRVSHGWQTYYHFFMASGSVDIV